MKKYNFYKISVFLACQVSMLNSACTKASYNGMNPGDSGNSTQDKEYIEKNTNIIVNASVEKSVNEGKEKILQMIADICSDSSKEINRGEAVSLSKLLCSPGIEIKAIIAQSKMLISDLFLCAALVHSLVQWHEEANVKDACEKIAS